MATAISGMERTLLWKTGPQIDSNFMCGPTMYLAYAISIEMVAKYRETHV